MRSHSAFKLVAACVLFIANTNFCSAWRREGTRRGYFQRITSIVPRGGSSQLQHYVEQPGQTSPNESGSTDTDTDTDDWRSDLPEQLKQRKGALYRFLVPTGVPLQNIPGSADENLCEVYVLGTAHVSKDSCEDVKLLMEHVQPDVLFIELCDRRIAILEDDESSAIEESDDSKGVGQMTNEIIAQNPGMNKAAAMSSVLLSKIQGDYATKLNVTIGGEFREAYHCANAQHKKFSRLVERLNFENAQGSINDETLQMARETNGCSVVLGDRPVRLTLLRAWEAQSFFGKIKLVLALAWSSLRQPSVEELREWIESIMNDPSNDILSKSIEELGTHFPAIKTTIIEERDMYMACKIVQTARIMGIGSSHDGKNRKIVAVVGAGHCPGISSILSGEIEQQGSLDAENELRKVVETKKHRVDNDLEMKMLITEVSSMELVQ